MARWHDLREDRADPRHAMPSPAGQLPPPRSGLRPPSAGRRQHRLARARARPGPARPAGQGSQISGRDRVAPAASTRRRSLSFRTAAASAFGLLRVGDHQLPADLRQTQHTFHGSCAYEEEHLSTPDDDGLRRRLRVVEMRLPARPALDRRRTVQHLGAMPAVPDRGAGHAVTRLPRPTADPAAKPGSDLAGLECTVTIR